MWVNYPHMPTGTLGIKSLKHWLRFAKKHAILLINDNPYSFILNDNPLVFLILKAQKRFV